jgi:hypothetical protein
VWDIKFAGYEHYVGMDSILNNAIFISPFWGNFRCSWCDIVIVTTGLPTLISHILCDHRRIQQSHFSCPCCIGTTVLNWDSWPGHFERNHAPGQAFAMVLNELAANSRYGWGIAVMAAISCCTLLGAELDEGDEPEAKGHTLGRLLSKVTERECPSKKDQTSKGAGAADSSARGEASCETAASGHRQSRRSG